MTAPKVADTPLAKLTPAEWNPRTIRDERFKNLCASIEADPEFLWRRPVLATADGTIYAGNMRYRAAAHLGRKSIPAIVEDVPEQLAKERALRDNAQWGDWHDDQLAEMVYQMAASGSDVKLLGIEEDELARLLGLTGADGTEGLTDPDELPENVPTRSKRGDLWLLGEHRVLCGDATSAEDVGRVLGGGKPAVTFTDPPYGIDYRAMRRPDAIANDESPDVATGIILSALVVGPRAAALFACCDWRSVGDVGTAMAGAGYEPKCCIVWDKERGVQNLDRYFKQHEFILYSGPYGGEKTVAGDVWRFPRDFAPDHPTPKPVGLVQQALETSGRADAYDPFLGSGTTLIACEQLGRKCYGLEIEPKYVDVILQRWENFTGKTAVLA